MKKHRSTATPMAQCFPIAGVLEGQSPVAVATTIRDAATTVALLREGGHE